MLGNLLTNVTLWVYSTLQSLFSTPDYRIADTSMEYFLDYTKTPLPEELDEFWYKERNEWNDDTESVFKTLNYSNYKETTIPENVTKTVVRVKYWYNNIMYKYLTYDMDHPWPPRDGAAIRAGPEMRDRQHMRRGLWVLSDMP